GEQRSEREPRCRGRCPAMPRGRSLEPLPQGSLALRHGSGRTIPWLSRGCRLSGTFSASPGSNRNVSTALAIERTATELDDLTLARVQKGDGDAFRVVIELYQDAVFALLWRFFGRGARPDLVEDVAQETFVGVYRSIARFRPDGPARLSTWILTIATRTAIKA